MAIYLKEYLKNIVKPQADAASLKDSSKVIMENCVYRVKIEIAQALRLIERRLNRIIRRQSRIMKCERKNAKLEQFEGMVDDIMDWIYDTEFLLTNVVESTYIAVKDRAEQFEVWLYYTFILVYSIVVVDVCI